MTEQISLAVFDPFTALIAKVQEEDAALAFDHTTPDGEKDLRSWVRTVRGYRAGLEKIRVRAKEDALEYGRKVDGKAKELKAPFDKIITERMKPLDEIEAAKRAEAEALIKAEQEAAEKAETERLADLKKREDEVSRKEAEQKVAEDAANAEQREVERVEREKKIAAEAAGKATRDAEDKAQQEAQRIKDEAAKIAADLVAEEARIKAKTLTEQEHKDKIEADRVADESHRKSVEDDIYTALLHFVDVGPCASAIVAHMKAGEIPHITIQY